MFRIPMTPPTRDHNWSKSKFDTWLPNPECKQSLRLRNTHSDRHPDSQVQLVLCSLHLLTCLLCKNIDSSLNRPQYSLYGRYESHKCYSISSPSHKAETLFRSGAS